MDYCYSVYPRWRGEHTRPYQIAVIYLRFIPAGAGNTVDGEFFIAGAPVYPRWRGEHDRLRHLAVADQGLSPLARGTPAVGTVKLRYCRFIPAGAGNTIEIVFGIYSEAVYPRWRGEHNEYWSSILMRRGLSPLARGTPHHQHPFQN